MNILVVSGGPRITSQVMTALIGGADVSYTEVRTPQRALALIDEGQEFHIVVADCDTTPTGGFFLAREVKSRVRMGRDMPPVLLLVARSDDSYLARWSEADAWILKPVDPFDLAQTVEALVEGEPVPRLPGVSTPAGAGEVDEGAVPGGLSTEAAAADQP